MGGESDSCYPFPRNYAYSVIGGDGFNIILSSLFSFCVFCMSVANYFTPIKR